METGREIISVYNTVETRMVRKRSRYLKGNNFLNIWDINSTNDKWYVGRVTHRDDLNEFFQIHFLYRKTAL